MPSCAQLSRLVPPRRRMPHAGAWGGVGGFVPSQAGRRTLLGVSAELQRAGRCPAHGKEPALRPGPPLGPCGPNRECAPTLSPERPGEAAGAAANRPHSRGDLRRGLPTLRPTPPPRRLEGSDRHGRPARQRT